MSHDHLYPKDNSEYQHQSYWEERYTKDTGTYEWFRGWQALRHILVKYIPADSRLLNLGCGNSTITEDIYDEYGAGMDIENIDFSEICIQNMEERNREKRPSMKWLVMDILDLKYEDETFDIVLDKGTMDAIMCEKGDVWNVSEDLAAKIDAMLTGVSRILKPGGKYIYITFGQPHFRKPLMLKDKYGWTFQQETIGDCFHYFIYVLTKSK
jgi:ubiquinone/menaquinone biosynthesis C-methylase UbiE